MHPSQLEQLAEDLLAGRLSKAQFAQALASPSRELDALTLDLDRARRCGFPEVVYGETKSTAQLRAALAALLEAGMPALATRVSPEKAAELLASFPDALYNPLGRTFRLAAPQQPKPESNGRPHERTTIGFVPVVTAGTSDLPVAEEARETLQWMNVRTAAIHDVGVAGPHRLPSKLPQLQGADAVVVVAGMEGALPSVVGGYMDCPVIAVPTSVGYGAALGGIAALLGMLNSCAANVTVVNIDAGFKAGYVAGLIAHRRRPSPGGTAD